MEHMKQEQVINMLQFDTKAFRLEYLKIFEEELYAAKVEWEFEVIRYLGHPYFSKHAKVWGEVDRKINHIILHLKANTYALADTYGTGSLMTSDNPGFKEYVLHSSYWNPARNGKAIVGRPKGTYTNLFGQERSSKGTYEGQVIEKKTVYKGGKKYKILPGKPSLAIKIANQYLRKQWIPIAIKNTTKRINLGKFLKEVK